MHAFAYRAYTGHYSPFHDFKSSNISCKIQLEKTFTGIYFGDIYLIKKKLDEFYFSVISWVTRNPTCYISIFITLVYVHHTHLFSTRLTFQDSLYATKICFCMFCTCTVVH